MFAVMAMGAFAAPAIAPAHAEAPPSIVKDTARNDFDALGPYMGHWRSEEKTTQDGRRTYRFEYELAYFDTAKTIAKMTILQVYANGEQNLLWTGFKGWDPIEQETYYYAFSPLGRVSSGRFAMAGELFMTFYDAFDSRGQAVEIRDVFEPVKGGEFDNVSFLRLAGEQEWRVIARDTWQRIE